MTINDRRSRSGPRVARQRSARQRSFVDAVRAGVPVDAAGHVVAMDRLGAEQNLVFEIGCCRVALSYLMEVDAIDARDPREFARVVRALTSALTAAVRLQRQIEMEGGSDTSEALTALLLELGTGGES